MAKQAVKTYELPDKIPDEDIKQAFQKAQAVQFSARRNNCVEYRYIAFGKLGWWLPLDRVLPLLGITPQMLRPVFNPWFEYRGRERGRAKWVRKFLPQQIGTYEELGSFELDPERFARLAKVLNKYVRVFREDGSSGQHNYLFTAHPSGRISHRLRGHAKRW